MDKFKIIDFDKDCCITCYIESNGEAYCYTFYNTPLGTISVSSHEDYSHQIHPLMILMELEGNMSDIWWCNTSKGVKDFDELCKFVLEDKEYFNNMFKLCTEHVINESLKELNNLIDYTKYWTDE